MKKKQQQWRAEKYLCMWRVIDENGNTVCELPIRAGADRDAGLIAAAPEMQELLEFFSSCWCQGEVIGRQHEYKVIELLKKTKGE